MIAWPRSQTRETSSQEVAAIPGEAAVARSPVEEVHRQARERAENQLRWADLECRRRLAECLEPIRGFFRDAEQGIPGFVDEALVWRSKWNFVLDRLPFTAKGRYEAFLREAFERHLFTSSLPVCFNKA